MLDFLKYKKTNYVGGFAFFDEAQDRGIMYSAVPEFIAPRKIDSRDMCLISSDQSTNPFCVGYATAGYLEIQGWAIRHYPKQCDADAIYNEAKKIDGHPEVKGTWLNSGVQAAINLGYVMGNVTKVTLDRNSIKFAVHQYRACIAAFMITNEWNQVDKSTGLIRNLGSNVNVMGGHAVLICGYNDQGVFIQNSWSPNYGIYGFVILPWELFDKQLRDAMIIDVKSINY